VLLEVGSVRCEIVHYIIWFVFLDVTIFGYVENISRFGGSCYFRLSAHLLHGSVCLGLPGERSCTLENETWNSNLNLLSPLATSDLLLLFMCGFWNVFSYGCKFLGLGGKLWNEGLSQEPRLQIAWIFDQQWMISRKTVGQGSTMSFLLLRDIQHLLSSVDLCQGVSPEIKRTDMRLSPLPI
jgi:hypothetical protein